MLHYFTARRAAGHISVTLITPDALPAWQTGNQALAARLAHLNFTGKPSECAVVRGDGGQVEHIVYGVNKPLKFYDLAALPGHIVKAMHHTILPTVSFDIGVTLSHDELVSAYAAWALGCIQMEKDRKAPPKSLPQLAVQMDETYQSAESLIGAITMLRDLVNAPANELGPDELEKHALKLAKDLGADETTVIRDGELLKLNFPLIYTVGMASHRRPRLIEFTWGNLKHPRVAIVGKGVCFDSGGLDIKTSDGMRLMKKDMGGAAHALALAKLIMDARLPVCLHVVIPAVENSIDGNAYRPGDVYKSRKGLTVEIGNTDAEGRLILVDAMQYAIEQKPDFLVNFCTLTGAARGAMGTELMPVFANKPETGRALQETGLAIDDPIWHMPLWTNYREDLDSDVADIGSVGGKAGMITAALFLQAFVGTEQDWAHFDIFSWRENAKPGRPKGGYETALRAVFTYLKKRYGQTA